MLKNVVRITLLFIGVLIAFVVFQAIRPPETLSVSPSTTIVTEPLRQDGTPDYGKFVLSKWRDGVTPENNGAVPFWKAFWPSDLSPEQQAAIQLELQFTADPDKAPFRIKGRELWDQVRRAIVEKSIDDEMGMMSSMDEVASPVDISSLIQGAITSQPWTRTQLPMVADWIDRHAEDYEWLRQAATAERFYSPPALLLTDPDASLTDAFLDVELTPMRDASDALAARIMLRIGEKQYAAAWDDCLTGLRLSDQIPDSGVFSRLIQLALRGAMFRAANELLSADLPKDLVSQIIKDLDSFQWNREMAGSIDTFERMAALDLAVSTRPSEQSPNERSAQQLTFYNRFVDRNVTVEHINAFYDESVEALRASNYRERQQLLLACEERLAAEHEAILMNAAKSVFSRSARAKTLLSTYLYLLTPALAAASTAEDRIVLDERFTRLHARLAAYRKENGAYPDQLDQLTVESAAASNDPVFEGSLKYRRTSDGFLLYSLGGNQQDNDGSNARMDKWQGWDLSSEDGALVAYIANTDSESAPATADAQPSIESETPVELQIPQDADDHALRVHGYQKDLSEASESLLEFNVTLP